MIPSGYRNWASRYQDESVGFNRKSFGRLTVLSPQGRENGRRRWLWPMECGTEKGYNASWLAKVQGRAVAGIGNKTAARLTTHGMTDTPLFSVWAGILPRCRNPNGKSFKNYGARASRAVTAGRHSIISTTIYRHINLE